MGTTLIRRAAAAIALALSILLPAARAQNYSDIWWNSSESGWGITIADHQSQLFAVWFTYRDDGHPMWYVIPGGAFSTDRRTFQGDIYATTGPSYAAVPFDPARVAVRKVGTATIDFMPAGLAPGTALFTYSIGSVSQTKRIQRQPFGDAEPAWGSDVTDIWFNPAESGWGLTLAQHGNNVFGVWFTYDTDGQPLWAVMPGVTFSGPDAFTGNLYTTTGPSFAAAVFDPSKVVATLQGSATVAVSRQGSSNPQCSGNVSATFAPSFRGSAPRAPICPQAFGDTLVTLDMAAPGAADLVPAGGGAGAQQGSAAFAASGILAADVPELADLFTSFGQAEVAARNAALGQLLGRVGSVSATKASGDVASFGNVGFAIASLVSSFGSVSTNGQAVPQQGASSTQSVEGGSVSLDMGVSTTGDGGATVSLGLSGSAENKNGKVEEGVSIKGEGKSCPAADGTLPFKFTIKGEVRASVAANGKRAGAQQEVEVSGTARVNDAAYIEQVDFDARVQSAKQSPDTHNAYIDGTYKGSLTGQWVDNYKISISTTFNLNRYGSTTTVDDARELLTDARAKAIAAMQGYLEFMQYRWRNGDCVEVIASAPGTVAPGATVSIDAKVRHKVERVELHLPVDSSLAGAASLQPARIAAAPGTFVYVAPGEADRSATLTFTTTSRRGIGTLALTIRTAAVKQFEVDWSGGGNHVFGTICGGLDSAFTLNFTSGTDIQGTLAFAPTGASGGNVHLSGTGIGGTITYSGDGTYGLTGETAIQMTIPQQTATVHLPTGPQVIQLPGPSGTLPLLPTTKCAS